MLAAGVQDSASAVGAVHPCLGMLVLCSGSQRHLGAACWGVRLGGPAYWSRASSVSKGRQPGRGRSQFLLWEPCAIGWKHAHPVMAHRGTLELPARVADSWATCPLEQHDHSVYGQAARKGEV